MIRVPSIAKLVDSINSNPPNSSTTSTPGRTSVRGVLANDITKEAMAFQFNPTEMSVNKRNVWEYVKFTGKSEVSTIWISGDVKEIRFSLWLDASASSTYKHMGGIVKMAEATDSNNARIESDNQVLNSLKERGTYFYTEFLESLVYPRRVSAATPIFVSGVYQAQSQFLPPPVTIFVFGDIYMSCKVVDLNISHKLFDKNLYPRRTLVDITLTVNEGFAVQKDVTFTNLAGITTTIDARLNANTAVV